ncbi:hypothetical protein KY331_03330, partial [Candidatus Woesearchaeota archaeon]|nr:hypothetical protein [Candidatus Woesearchaeota archaeon]
GSILPIIRSEGFNCSAITWADSALKEIGKKQHDLLIIRDLWFGYGGEIPKNVDIKSFGEELAYGMHIAKEAVKNGLEVLVFHTELDDKAAKEIKKIGGSVLEFGSMSTVYIPKIKEILGKRAEKQA